jgi:histidinol dehydrogenase
MRVFQYPMDLERLKSVVSRSQVDLSGAKEVSSRILQDIRLNGDAALFKYTREFDHVDLSRRGVRVPAGELRKAAGRQDKRLLAALRHAGRNITRFHKRQLSQVKGDWNIMVEQGVSVGERVSALESVGCYVPGGRASYPSTVLMTCIPAKVAGVRRVVVASPPEIPDSILAACHICGVDEVYRMGGAQAIGALAYGTASIKPVCKIVGPGNKYVLAAKSLVYGIVDVDMPAGPSEVLIIADDTADPGFVSADLWAQAEHDPDAQCVLASTSKRLIEKVSEDAPGNAVGILAGRIRDCIDFANLYAPEHLEVLTRNPRKVAGKVVNAGAIFIGPYSPVPVGDYASGGNHVLPTGGAARFASPLGVRDFLKVTSIQEVSRAGLMKLGTSIRTLARAEGLEKHAKSVETRQV